MFQRFHAMREEREGGFTLIELLVVILIIAILAAIAIPVFLKQREKGWIGQMESSLKDASIAAESYATGPGDGNYAGLTLALLEDEGFNQTDEVTPFSVTLSADNNKWCFQVSHFRYKGAEEPMAMASDTGTPKPGTCSAGLYVEPVVTP
jgi:prepilin-type N-terminal cleavage/methylation domain-containing protein